MSRTHSGTRGRGIIGKPASCGCVIALLVCAMAVAATAADYGDISINVQEPPQGQTFHGYVEYRVTVANRGASAHAVDVRLPAVAYGGGNWLRQIRASAVVPPQSTVVLRMLQPALPLSGANLGVWIDGRMRDPLGLTLSGHGQSYWYAHSTHAARILFSQRVPGTIMDKLAKVQSLPAGTSAAAYSHASQDSVQAIRSNTGPELWSPNWLAYTAYDGIVLSARDLEAMSGPTRDALWRYTEAGGILTVLGSPALPPQWVREKQPSGQLTTFIGGFGRCLVDPADNLDRWSDGTWQSMLENWRRSARMLGRQTSVDAANREFPLVKGLAVPARGMLILLILFALAIGPLNLIALNRIGRRLWMLWTIPVLSVLTSLVIFGYALAAEGWTATVRSTSITLLDERTHRTTTLGTLGIYSPLTPGGGMTFSAGTEVDPQVQRWGAGTPRTMDWTHAQHLSTGWVSARVPAHFQLRRSDTRRERITLDRSESGKLFLVNGLGAGIQRLLLADQDGRCYEAADVAAGARAPLKLLPGKAGATVPALLRDVFAQPFAMSRVDQELEVHRRWPGSYAATLDADPFLEPGLKEYRRWDAQCLVIGVLEEEPGDAR